MLEVPNHLRLNLITGLNIGIEVRPSCSRQTLGREIGEIVVGEDIVMLCQSDKQSLLRAGVAVYEFNRVDAVGLR